MSALPLKIPAELFALAESSVFHGTHDLGFLEVGPDDYTFSSPLEWNVEVTNTGSALLVAGKVTGSGVAHCSRCLEEVEWDFEGDVEGYFIIGEPGIGDWEDEEGEKLGDDEFEMLPADHVIDLEPLLVAALLVDAPQVPLCREDCAGLCPQCGANLNEGTCGCVGEGEERDFDRAANPFSVLEDYRFEG